MTSFSGSFKAERMNVRNPHYIYTIDGKYVSTRDLLHEATARDVCKSTVLQRLHRGARTRVELFAPPHTMPFETRGPAIADIAAPQHQRPRRTNDSGTGYKCWKIEGKWYSSKQLAAGCPDVKRATVLARAKAGATTWTELRAPLRVPVKAPPAPPEYFEVEGQQYTITEVAARAKINESLAGKRLRRGVNTWQALSAAAKTKPEYTKPRKGT